MTTERPDAADVAGEPDVVEFYWRPGCMFCASLRRSLGRRGIPVELHNIWEDPEAGDVVRSVAGGNETVPTVFVGEAALVNPTPQAVERLLAEQAPGMLAAADVEREGRSGSWMRRLFGSR